MFAFEPATVAIKIQGWCEDSGLWRFNLINLELKTDKIEYYVNPHKNIEPKFKARNACDIPSAEALMKFYSAATGFPIKKA